MHSGLLIRRQPSILKLSGMYSNNALQCLSPALRRSDQFYNAKQQIIHSSTRDRHDTPVEQAETALPLYVQKACRHCIGCDTCFRISVTSYELHR